MKIIALCLAFACLAHAESAITFNLDPTKENPRNSEGSFATLASGRIIFCYSHFYGGAGDESPARIVRVPGSTAPKKWTRSPWRRTLFCISQIVSRMSHVFKRRCVYAA